MARDGVTRGYPSGMGLTSVITNLLFSRGTEQSSLLCRLAAGGGNKWTRTPGSPGASRRTGPPAGGGTPDARVGGRGGRWLIGPQLPTLTPAASSVGWSAAGDRQAE